MERNFRGEHRCYRLDGNEVVCRSARASLEPKSDVSKDAFGAKLQFDSRAAARRPERRSFVSQEFVPFRAILSLRYAP